MIGRDDHLDESWTQDLGIIVPWILTQGVYNIFHVMTYTTGISLDKIIIPMQVHHISEEYYTLQSQKAVSAYL